MTGYHILITLLDRSSPNLSRRILRGTPSIRSAGRTPHPTPTGLPGQLDFQIACSPSYFPTHPDGFWTDFSQAPTTRLGERWDNLEEASPPSPTAFWYEPESIFSNSTVGSSFTPAPTLDYRFGPISLDWIDYPANHPAFGIPVQASQASELQAATYHPPNHLADLPQPQMKSTASQFQNHSKPSTSSPASQNTPASTKLNIPTGEFVPIKVDDKIKYQLGSTDFGYGSIHLYRDVDDASSTKSASQPQPDSSASISRQKQAETTFSVDLQDINQEQLNQQDDLCGMVVGVLAIPSYMTSQDFLAFISSVVESVESVRMLRDSFPNRCIGLIKFRSHEAAKLFATNFNGKPFSHLQDREICHTAFIKSIRFKPSLIPPFTFPALLPPDLLTQKAHELPTCPVCLERMDVSVTGLITNTCSHTFHCHCLSHWGDSRCPICRYSQSKLNQSSHPDRSECAACGSQANLWICLICGHVGCGRYQGGHAYRHFEESSHLYALELGSQRVWDYVGDNYVHRLIQTKTDQIVELPALSSAVFDSGGGPGRNEAGYQSKIEAISEEFGHLVASQLDSQREFYAEEMEILHSRLEAAKRETGDHRAQIDKLEVQMKELELAKKCLEQEAKQQKARLEKKKEKALQMSKKLEAELKEEQLLSEGMRQQLKKLEEEKVDQNNRTQQMEEELSELKDQLRDLMFFIDAQSKIQNENGSELQGGSIVVRNPPPPPSRSSRKAKK
ncbi:hypothetical protein O181_022198 [Austropuccinia psidii MF-1]|uniref:BRCA1-associated protein n=1 Tax=Austropuccinia psidii MF-1 TaxID=1389203 RepID=A0A9Q3GW44_9BASI|nr:hypothetical protein [Austropuccinia psidii MF-1]